MSEKAPIEIPMQHFGVMLQYVGRKRYLVDFVENVKRNNPGNDVLTEATEYATGYEEATLTIMRTFLTDTVESDQLYRVIDLIDRPGLSDSMLISMVLSGHILLTDLEAWDRVTDLLNATHVANGRESFL